MKKYERRVKEHEDKITNPNKYIPNWNSLDQMKKDVIMRHWKKEIANFHKSIDNRIKELKKRGEYSE